MHTSSRSGSSRTGLSSASLVAQLVLPLVPVCLLAAACTNGIELPEAAAPAPPNFVTPPQITSTGTPFVPLVATISLETDVPTQVELTLADGVREWTELAEPEYRTGHARIPVLGMRPGRMHEIQVTVRDAQGNAFTAPQSLFTMTPGLPPTFPAQLMISRDPAAMEPGVTIYTPFAIGAAGGFVVGIDDSAEVVWVLDGTKSALTAGHNLFMNRLPNGNILVLAGTQQILEISMLGDVVQIWYANRFRHNPPPGATLVDVDSFHHDARPLPPGEEADFVSLSTELRQYSDYPADEVDPGQTKSAADVVGDRIIEFKRDGTIVRELNLLDILDPRRISYDSLGGDYDFLYQSQDTEDWSHGNSVWLDESDDSYIVSLRHQDAVVKIARQTGELVWILGDPRRWDLPWADKLLAPSLTAPFEWPFHQHDAVLTSYGSLLLFDNGNNRAIPPDPPLPFGATYSRAVEFGVDAGQGTVEQLWAYGGMYDAHHPFFSTFVGGVERMPVTGNVLVMDGGRRLGESGPLYARLVEVTHEVPPRVVFEINVFGGLGFSAYRAERWPSLYR